jgi:acetylornithine deacetylase/succinyl-diaminopimelate desuccinylase-like protein
MVNYDELMALLSTPRHTGSPADRRTARALATWLAERSIPHRVEPFRLYPYFNENLGIWFMASRTLLALAAIRRWGWRTTLIAGVSLLGGLVDVGLNIPLVTWSGARRGDNILVEFGPPEAERELIIAAHYDSKTQLLDHRQFAFLLRHLNTGIGLTVALGLLGVLQEVSQRHKACPAVRQAHEPRSRRGTKGTDNHVQREQQNLRVLGVLGDEVLALALSLPMLGLAYGLGLNLVLGRFAPASQGAVDNGAACAVLLGLAERVARGELPLRRTRLVLALFGGEEANMQGSRAYVRGRRWPLPAAAVNLEFLGQNGPYVVWTHEGNALRTVPTSPAVTRLAAEAVAAVTGEPPRPVGGINSDGFSFLEAGIPATVLGTYDAQLGGTELHRPGDNLARVVLARLPEHVAVLAELVRRYDA